MNTRTIPLNRNVEAIVDADLYEWLNQWNWTADFRCNGPYVLRRVTVEPKKRVAVHMHRAIVCAVDGQIVDHINGDTLDNRRENLRVCTTQENLRNNARPTGKSGFRGVYPSNNKWIVKARDDDGILQQIGRFECPVKAARAYDKAMIERRGEFAVLNFPKDGFRSLQEEAVACD